ncbi:hypothetical protein BH10PSE10_BH10PSE10_18620 [soil metagenome]
MDGDDEFTFPVDRDALTPERWNALKRFAVRRAHAERSAAIREMMMWLRTRLHALRRRPAFGVASSRRSKERCVPPGHEAIAHIPSSRSRMERT